MSTTPESTPNSQAGLWFLLLLVGALTAAMFVENKARQAAAVQADSKERLSQWHKKKSASNAKARSVWPDVVRMDGRGKEMRHLWPDVTRLEGRRKRVRKEDFDPSQGMSEACEELNKVVLTGMKALHDAGAPPPFPVSPLMEVLRAGECEPSEPTVRVLMIWLKAATDVQGVAWSGFSSHNNSRSQ